MRTVKQRKHKAAHQHPSANLSRAHSKTHGESHHTQQGTKSTLLAYSLNIKAKQPALNSRERQENTPQGSILNHPGEQNHSLPGITTLKLAQGLQEPRSAPSLVQSPRSLLRRGEVPLRPLKGASTRHLESFHHQSNLLGMRQR